MALNYSIIGMRLKQARIDKKLTQEKLAEELDVSVAYVSRVERGSTEIGLKRLDLRQKGFNGMIAIITVGIICQILPIVFAIVITRQGN